VNKNSILSPPTPYNDNNSETTKQRKESEKRVKAKQSKEGKSRRMIVVQPLSFG